MSLRRSRIPGHLLSETAELDSETSLETNDRREYRGGLQPGVNFGSGNFLCGLDYLNRASKMQVSACLTLQFSHLLL